MKIAYLVLACVALLAAGWFTGVALTAEQSESVVDADLLVARSSVLPHQHRQVSYAPATNVETAFFSKRGDKLPTERWKDAKGDGRVSTHGIRRAEVATDLARRRSANSSLVIVHVRLQI